MDVEDEAVSWELLARLDAQDIAWLGVGPGDWQEALDLSRDHEVLDLLVVDLVCNLALAVFEGQVPHAHQSEVDRERDDWERQLDLIVFLRVKDEEEEDDGEDVLEMERRVNCEVPETEGSLIPVCKDFVRVLRLVTDHLVQLAALEFHLLLVELVLNDVGTSLSLAFDLLVALLLIIDLVHAHRDALPVVAQGVVPMGEMVVFGCTTYVIEQVCVAVRLRLIVKAARHRVLQVGLVLVLHVAESHF